MAKRKSRVRIKSQSQIPYQFLNMRLFAVGVGVAVIHIYNGVSILLGYKAIAEITPVAFLTHLIGNITAVGVVLIVVGLLALRPFMVGNIGRVGFILCVAPQQVVLLMHSVSVIVATVTGHYPDGYAPADGGVFISNDQAAWVVVSIGHTYKYYMILFHYDWLIGRSSWNGSAKRAH